LSETVGEDLVIGRGRLVLGDEVVKGSLKVEAGRIAALDPGESLAPGAVDLEGDFLIPGLIDLHTDHLERHFQPRSGVLWDPVSAAISHDAQVIGSGITTVFDSLTVGANQGWDLRDEMIQPLCDALLTARRHDMLKADHLLHLRCEVTHPDIVRIVEPYRGNPLWRFMSLMDHAPGDRQSPDIERWRSFNLKHFGFDAAALDRYEQDLIRNSRTFGSRHRRALGDFASENRIPLASHDDASTTHIEEAAGLGAVLTEFPTTSEAAAAARQHGLHVLMGSPNLVRGGSHSGNVAAGALAEAGYLDILSSDYIPGSLLTAAFLLADGSFGLSLPQAIRTVTRIPAEAADLDDRGEVRECLLADLVRVRLVEGRPLVRAVWRKGRRVA
jgi:alpha-D-ribose 1-methylphosphonate 5-triphosphate diphosphatase